MWPYSRMSRRRTPRLFFASPADALRASRLGERQASPASWTRSDASQGRRGLSALACERRSLPRLNHNVNAERRSEEQKYELQSLMRTSYAVFCLKKKSRTQM